MTKQSNVLLIASENGAFAGAKVGGMADVIRDLPAPMAEQSVLAHQIMPAYGFLHSQTNAQFLGEFLVEFRSSFHTVQLYKTPNPNVSDAICYFLDHPYWHSSPGQIYSDSGNRPFADDANKFAFFSVAVAEALHLEMIQEPDVIHLNDWHAAFFALYTNAVDRYRALNSIPTAMSIHNLAIQGIRPLQNDDSSLEAWFPELYDSLSKEIFDKIVDPRYPDCINPMRMGINLSDRVHVVSPTYAKEVIKPSNPESGFFGGEGLEQDLINKGKNLFGVINGTNYPQQRVSVPETFLDFIRLSLETVIKWQGGRHAVSGQDYIADKRLSDLLENSFEPDFLITSVGRLTDQKVLILRQPYGAYQTVLDALLARLKQFSDNALFIMLGSGDAKITSEFRQVAARHSNFIFLNGYAEDIPDWLYQNGDLFLMPSSFEPCGISQMLAMKEGQPCIVHGVGGLKDTVEHDKSGFVFAGENLAEQSEQMLEMFDYILEVFQSERWKKIRQSAKARRFSWQKVCKQLIKKLYRL